MLKSEFRISVLPSPLLHFNNEVAGHTQRQDASQNPGVVTYACYVIHHVGSNETNAFPQTIVAECWLLVCNKQHSIKS